MSSSPYGQTERCDSGDDNSIPFHSGWRDSIPHGSTWATHAITDPVGSDDTCQTRHLGLESVDVTRTVISGDPMSGVDSSISTRILANLAEDARPDSADYTIHGELGRGGMGCVYLASQSSLRRTVAIKAMRADRRSPERSDAFLGEAWVTGSLDHPNIVPIYDAAIDQSGAPFYAMRRIQGREWSETMADSSLEENVEVLIRVGDAIAYAHDQGVLHRDLKPTNIMLGDYGEVLVLDWGLAVGITPEAQATPLDSTHMLAGTPSYLPPETARGEVAKIGVPSDVYLLGAMLCEIISGDPPHRGDTVRDCLASSAAGRIPEVDCDSVLAQILRTALAYDPGDRYQSVKEMQVALRKWESHRRSLALSTEARARIAPAKIAASPDPYAEFTQAIATFQVAIDEWADNTAASRGLSEARLAFAQRASGQGDLELADAQLRPLRGAEDDLGVRARDLAESVAGARARRLRRRRQIKGMLAAIIGLVLVVIGSLLSGYILVDRARSDLARTNVELDAERVSLAESLEREEQTNQALAATNVSLDMANVQLMTENIGARLRLMATSLDAPGTVMSDLFDIDPAIPFARSWPWRRLLAKVSTVYQRIGGVADQQLIHPTPSPDGAMIAALRTDGHMWLVPTANQTAAKPVNDLGFVPWYQLWASDSNHLLVGGIRAGSAVVNRSGRVLWRSQADPVSHFGGFFARGTVVVFSHRRVTGVATKDGSQRWLIEDIEPKWYITTDDRQRAVITDVNGRVWILDTQRGRMQETALSTLPSRPTGHRIGFYYFTENADRDPFTRIAMLDDNRTALVLTEDRSIWRLDLSNGNAEPYLDTVKLGTMKVPDENLSLQVDRFNDHTVVLVHDGKKGWSWVLDDDILRSPPVAVAVTMTGFQRPLPELDAYASPYARGSGVFLRTSDTNKLLTNRNLPANVVRNMIVLPDSVGVLTLDERGVAYPFNINRDGSGAFAFNVGDSVSLTGGAAPTSWQTVASRRRGRSQGDGSGAVIAFESDDGRVHFWSSDYLAGKTKVDAPMREVIGYYANAAPCHGPFIMVGGGGRQDLRRLADIGKRVARVKLSFGRFRIRTMAASPDEQLVAVSDINGTAQVFKVGEEQALITSTKEGNAVTAMAINKHGQIAFGRIPHAGTQVALNRAAGMQLKRLDQDSVSGTSELEIWSADSAEQIASWTIPGYAREIAWDPADGALVVVGYDGSIHRVDPGSGEVLASMNSSLDEVYAVAVLPSARRIALSGAGGRPQVVSFDLDVVGRAPVSAGLSNRIAMGPGGELVAELMQDFTFRIWSVASGVELHREQLQFGLMDSRGLGWDPHLIWDHATDRIFMFVKSFKAWVIPAAAPGSITRMPQVNDAGERLTGLLKLLARMPGHRRLWRNLIDDALVKAPHQVAVYLPDLMLFKRSYPDRDTRLDLLQRFPPGDANSEAGWDHSLAMVDSMVGDLDRPAGVVEGLDIAVYLEAEAMLHDLAPYLNPAAPIETADSLGDDQKRAWQRRKHRIIAELCAGIATVTERPEQAAAYRAASAP